MNPSFSADSKVFIDFNLVGVSNFITNNYVYVNGGLNSINNAIQANQTVTENYNTANAPYSVHQDFLLQGPSVSLSLGKLGLGLYSGARSALSINGVPNHLANHIRNGFDFGDQLGDEYTTNNLRVGALAWLEYGLNGSYIIKQEGRDMMTVGGTVKILNGLTGAGVIIQEWNYEVENDSLLNSLELRGKYGLHDIENSQQPIGNGSGLGIDLGFNYKSMKKGNKGYLPHSKEGCRLQDYNYKFGVSLLDFGRIKFSDGISREFNIQDSLEWQNYSGAQAGSIQSVDDLIELELLTPDSLITASTSSLSNEFKVLLPSALAFQFDYNIGNGFYGNATLVHGFNRKNKFGVERSSILAVTPRFESKPVDVAVPIVLRNYESIRVGFSIRVYYLTIGSDNIFSLIGGENRETYGSDIYVNLKYSMFRPWYCSESQARTKTGRRKKTKGGQPCPSW